MISDNLIYLLPGRLEGDTNSVETPTVFVHACTCAHILLLFSSFFGSFTYSGDLEQQIFTGFKLALSLFKTHIVNHLHPFTVAVLRSPNFTTNIRRHSSTAPLISTTYFGCSEATAATPRTRKLLPGSETSRGLMVGNQPQV